QDLQALVDLAQTLRQIKGRRGQLNVSVATFIPKAHTPFQWASQLSLEESRERIGWLQEKLRLPGVQFKWQNPEVSQLEGLWARGDRRLSRLLIAAHAGGCKFDGWSDKFQPRRWEEAIRQSDVKQAFFTSRRREVEEPLAWDHIDAGVSKSFLAQEWQQAQAGQATADCRRGVCHECGVCDFRQVKPRVYTPTPATAPSAAQTEKASPDGGYQRWRVEYSKQGAAKFFGHLEMVNIFLRALRRAGILLQYSQGFHPLPKISFDDPLPLGMESKQEFLYLSVPLDVFGERIVKGLNRHLPEGLHARDAHKAPAKGALQRPAAVTYRVTLGEGGFDTEALARFEQARECIFTRANRKGKLKKINLKDIISSLARKRPDRLEMALGSSNGITVRPADVLTTVFGLSPEQIKRAAIVKLYDEKTL
ncbi:MAG: TIGR03936 family radical SAM-associated protein, partial [Desulfobacterales bacterium]|nr:TIGR03936 family radical SAM-associated protein [Desulfobacterales bacterium]